MEGIFLKIINMSIVGTIVIFIILFARLLLKNKPKIFSYLLWFPVFFRLICPVSFYFPYSVVGMFNKDTNYIETETILLENSSHTSLSYQPNLSETVEISKTGSFLPNVSSQPVQDSFASVLDILFIVWLMGVFILLIYSFLSVVSIYKRTDDATLITENIYETDKIKSPFVLGFIPKIYIPVNIEKKDMHYIIAHEKTHIKRGDHIVKPFVFGITAIHWFNPFVWLAYSLMSKDMEMSCDESVIKNYEIEDTKKYSYALLKISVKNNALLRPIGFGESNVKSRIKNIMKYKNIKRTSAVAIIILCLAAGFFALANPHPANTNGKKLGEILSRYEGDEIVLNDVLNFDYDYVIQFPSYASKENMYEILGFRTSVVREDVNDGIMNILFVKNNKPVCYLYGYSSNNGFSLYLPDGIKIPKNEIGVFQVGRQTSYPNYSQENILQDYNFNQMANELC